MFKQDYLKALLKKKNNVVILVEQYQRFTNFDFGDVFINCLTLLAYLKVNITTHCMRTLTVVLGNGGKFEINQISYCLK